MSSSLEGFFSRKNVNMVVGLITLLVVLWIVFFAVPDLFVSLFKTGLGNLILVSFIALATMYDMNMGIGLAIVFVILWRFSHMNPEQFIL
jgi:hypothetical protein